MRSASSSDPRMFWAAILLITSHDLLSSFVKCQLIAHLLHRGSECFNLLLLLSELCLKGFLLPSKLRREVLLLLRDGHSLFLDFSAFLHRSLMLFQKFVEQHRVYRFVTYCCDLSIFTTND